MAERVTKLMEENLKKNVDQRLKEFNEQKDFEHEISIQKQQEVLNKLNDAEKMIKEFKMMMNELSMKQKQIVKQQFFESTHLNDVFSKQNEMLQKLYRQYD